MRFSVPALSPKLEGRTSEKQGDASISFPESDTGIGAREPSIPETREKIGGPNGVALRAGAKKMIEVMVCDQPMKRMIVRFGGASTDTGVDPPRRSLG
jgi:hypothetical protein